MLKETKKRDDTWILCLEWAIGRYIVMDEVRLWAWASPPKSWMVRSYNSLYQWWENILSRLWCISCERWPPFV